MSARRSSALVALAALFAALLAVDPAGADPAAAQRAKTLFTAGAQAFARGDFATAIEAFEEAYRVDPRPGLLFSLAQSHRRQFHATRRTQHLARAIAAYHAYLDAVAEGGRRAEAAQALVELEPLAARAPDDDASGAPGPRDPGGSPRAEPPPSSKTRLMVSTAAEGAVVSVDGGPRRPCPLLVAVDEGTHRIRVEAAGFLEEERAIVVDAGSTLAVDVALRERPASVWVTGDAGAEVHVDRRLVGRLPLGAPLSLRAGAHAIAVVANGHRAFTRELVLARGERAAVTAELHGTGQRTAAYATFGLAAAGAVAAGVFAIAAAARDAEASDLLDEAHRNNLTSSERDDYAAARAARGDLVTVALGTLGASAVVGLAGVALFAFDAPRVDWSARPGEPSPAPRRAAPEPLEVSIVPSASRLGARAIVTGSF